MPPDQIIRRRTLVAAVTALAVLLPGTVMAQVSPQLQQIRDRIDRVEAALDGAEGNAEAAAQALAGLEDEVAAVEDSVNAAAAAVRQQRVEVEMAGERLEQLRVEADTLEQALESRAVDMFMTSSVNGVGIVLSADDVQAAIDRSAFLDIVSGAGRNELEAVTSARVRLAAESQRFEAEAARLVALEEQERQLLDEVQRLRDAQAAVLDDAEADVDSLLAQRDDLEDDAGRIERLIEQARSTPVAATVPSTNGYIYPLCRRITSNFGYRWGRLHAGMDIDGNTGDPIGAAKEGVVIFAGYRGGYGNLVLVSHGGGVVTAYAHQSALLVRRGQSLERGELLGLVGNTGRSFGSHLHFEVRVNGRAIDPRGVLPNGC